MKTCYFVNYFKIIFNGEEKTQVYLQNWQCVLPLPKDDLFFCDTKFLKYACIV